jgi:hypothetical protein
MKETKTTIYECEFCGKYYKRKHLAINHESGCKLNPENFQRCIGCSFLEMKETTVRYDRMCAGENLGIYYVDEYRKKELLFCNKKQIHVYPYWTSNPILQEDIDGEIPNEPMLKECDFFKNHEL